MSAITFFPGASQFPWEGLLQACCWVIFLRAGIEGSLLLKAKSCKRGCTKSSSTAAKTQEAQSALTDGAGLLLEIWFSTSPANLALQVSPCLTYQQQTTGLCLLRRKDVPFLPKEPALTFGNRRVDRPMFKFPLNFLSLVSVSIMLLRKLFINETLHLLQ